MSKVDLYSTFVYQTYNSLISLTVCTMYGFGYHGYMDTMYVWILNLV